MSIVAPQPDDDHHVMLKPAGSSGGLFLVHATLRALYICVDIEGRVVNG